ncbi:MAG: hypothetical protein Q8R92_13665 [Deltaproteobacteria bacterium]|nr:hypothetical protein [Deltaproteobacteria bacterium]
MADLTYSQKATERHSSTGLVTGKGDANGLKVLVSSTVEIPPSASGATVKFGRIPSNARLSGISRVYWDDLTTTGSPTLDIGLASVNANITSDPDALSNGHAVSSADADGAQAIADPAEFGKPAYLNVNGQTTDPGGELDVYGSIVDAATVTNTGTVTLELFGYLD